MTLIADTSGILAAANAGDAAHEAVREAIAAEPGTLIVPDLVIPEVDYLILRYLGRAAEEAFLEDVLAGAWAREPLRDEDMYRAFDVLKKYRDHDVGIVDAVIVAVAERLHVERILTLDHRHFRSFRLWGRKPVTIVPQDAE